MDTHLGTSVHNETPPSCDKQKNQQCQSPIFGTGTSGGRPHPTLSKHEMSVKSTVFEPYKPKIRKSGTGCVTMINDHLYEGRFTPRINGKRISKNVYAKTQEECEEKLAELIKTMKAEIAEMKKAEKNA